MPIHFVSLRTWLLFYLTIPCDRSFTGASESCVANLPTSQTLLERLRERDQEAWKRLDYLYSPLVRNWYRDWGVPAADIEDLTQEALQAVSSGLGTFRRDRPGDSFRGWLRVISRHKFLDHARRMSGQPRAGRDRETCAC